jgi:hypothetical protein
MAARFLLPFLLTLPAVTVSATALRKAGQTCRYIPGDAGWPSQGDWARLNTTVGGRLIATVPVAHVCHERGTFAAFDKTACEDLGKEFQDAGPETLSVLPLSHFYCDSNPNPLLTLPSSCPVPGEIFNPYWQNETCSPFTSPWVPCELGNRAVYSINVIGPADVQAGLEFATENNIRLVIRNTGIE